MRNPADYNGEPVCPRCGSGWPNCRSGYTCEETCQRYNWGALCDRCDREVELTATGAG